MKDLRVAFSHTTDFEFYFTEVPVASIPLTLMIFEDIVPERLLFILWGWCCLGARACIYFYFTSTFANPIHNFKSLLWTSRLRIKIKSHSHYHKHQFLSRQKVIDKKKVKIFGCLEWIWAKVMGFAFTLLIPVLRNSNVMFCSSMDILNVILS